MVDSVKDKLNEMSQGQVEETKMAVFEFIRV